MLTVAQRFLGFALLALAVAVVAVIASITPSFQECKASPPTEKGQSAKTQTLHIAESIIGQETAVNIECVVVSLYENNGLITALATAFLAYITYRLVVGGEKTTRKVNRAYLAGGGDVEHDGQGNVVIRNGQKHFRVQLGNQGQTPADLYEYTIDFAMLKDVCLENKPYTTRYPHFDQYPPRRGLKLYTGSSCTRTFGLFVITTDSFCKSAKTAMRIAMSSALTISTIGSGLEAASLLTGDPQKTNSAKSRRPPVGASPPESRVDGALARTF